LRAFSLDFVSPPGLTLFNSRCNPTVLRPSCQLQLHHATHYGSTFASCNYSRCFFYLFADTPSNEEWGPRCPQTNGADIIAQAKKSLQSRMRRDQGTKRKKMSIFAYLAKGQRHGTIDPTRRREWSLCRHRAHDEDRRYLSNCNRCLQPRLVWWCRAPMGGV
jgi:hypothetical protein